MNPSRLSADGGSLVYVIVVYDVQADRTSRFLKLCRQYLTHVQYSVLEGRLSKGEADDLENQLSKLLEEGESAIVYRTSSEAVISRHVHGDDPREDERFL